MLKLDMFGDYLSITALLTSTKMMMHFLNFGIGPILSERSVIQAKSQKKLKFILFCQSYLLKTLIATTNMLYDS